MFIICDIDDVIQDMASHEVNLSRGLSYLQQGGHQYELDPATVDWQDNAQYGGGAGPKGGDHFDGSNHIADSPFRQAAYEEEQVRLTLQNTIDALREAETALAAEVSLTPDELSNWLNAIDWVAAASMPAEFTQRWAVYQKKMALFLVKAMTFIRNNIGD